jgi:glycosyltransferase involved in cell wall biosynthesis
MKIVLVAYHFPPDPAVGGLRASKIAHAMRSRGHDVCVIAGPLDPAVAGQGHNGDAAIRVQRITPLFDLRKAYAKLIGGLRSRGRANGSAPALEVPGSWGRPAQQPAWKRVMMSIVWLPDDKQGWVIPAARAAADEIRRGAQLLYTTSPPPSAHIVGLRARGQTGVRWAMEFRDPWTDNPSKPAFVRSVISERIEGWLERRCLHTADHIVTVTEATARRLRARMPAAHADRLMVVRNGIDATSLPREPVTGPPTIVYVGNLYSGRDPRPFFNAVGRLRARRALPEPLRIEFIGQCEYYEGTAVDDIANAAGVLDMLARVGTLSHAECLRRLRSAHALLLLAQGQPDQVPNKLYEYLGAGRPVIAFVDEGGETATMLNRANSRFQVYADDPAHAEAAIKSALDAAATETGALDQEVLREWSTPNQLDRLLTALAL